MQTAKIQASLLIGAVSPEPMLFAHLSSRPRVNFSPKTEHVALLSGQACTWKMKVLWAFFLQRSSFYEYFSPSKNNSVFSNNSRGSSMSDSPSLNGSVNRGRKRQPSGNKVSWSVTTVSNLISHIASDMRGYQNICQGNRSPLLAYLHNIFGHSPKQLCRPWFDSVDSYLDAQACQNK